MNRDGIKVKETISGWLVHMCIIPSLRESMMSHQIIINDETTQPPQFLCVGKRREIIGQIEQTWYEQLHQILHVFHTRHIIHLQV